MATEVVVRWEEGCEVPSEGEERGAGGSEVEVIVEVG